jgi:hypothetical protein
MDSMDSSIIETLKLLLKDTRTLSKRVSGLETATEGQDNELNQLEEELNRLEERLIQLEDSQPTPGAVPIGIAPSSPTGESQTLLDLPLAKIIDIYHEIPAILEPVCTRVALVPNLTTERIAETIMVERNRHGNYWVLQLRSQGFFLLPRPGAFDRLAALEGMHKLFDAEGDPSQDSEFVLQNPVSLTLIKRNDRWQLEQKGQLKFGESPLGFRWQQELHTLQEQYRHLTTLLETLGDGAIEFTLTAYRWLQQLEARYGKPVSIMVNTCVPIAYAIYKASDSQSVLVPCNVMTTANLVLPVWDRGVDWDSSIYAKFHSKDNRSVSRTSASHPYLPNQLFLKELHWESTHTWAIANDYIEAAAIITRLDGHWGSLAE